MTKTCSELFARDGLRHHRQRRTRRWQGMAFRSDRGRSRGTRSSASWAPSVDGHSFAQDAIDRGAKVLVVAERKVYLADATDVHRGGGVRHAQGHGPRRGELLRPSVRGRSRSWASPARTARPPRPTWWSTLRASAGKRSWRHRHRGQHASAARHGARPSAPRRNRPTCSTCSHGCATRAATVVAMEVSSHALDLLPHVGHRRSP